MLSRACKLDYASGVQDAEAELLDGHLARKVDFLRHADAYPHAAGTVIAVETHMSWVFLAGDRAYKLKKPLKLDYLDFSTLEKREQACRAELALNRRLAPHVYLGLAALRENKGRLSLDGPGQTIDCLVVMKRLDEGLMLDAEIKAHSLNGEKLRIVEDRLGRFYRAAHPVFATPVRYLARWRRLLLANRKVLLDPKLSMPVAVVGLVDRAQRRFLDRCGGQLLHRLQSGKIVDAHGDLRPEHIFLGEPLAIIDCLEFNPEFRAVDPFDELSYLAIECERLGAAAAGRAVIRRLSRVLSDGVTPELLTFYRAFRATLKANLSIAHLLDARPRTPEKWRPLALSYLAIARREALELDALLNRREARRAAGSRAAAGLRRRRGRRR